MDGQRLRYLRRVHGLSQKQFADRADLSVTTVAKLERQPQMPCRCQTMVRLAIALGEHPAAIIATFVPPPGT